MTDAHYHRGGYATFLSLGDREFRFYGIHPWEAADFGEAARLPLHRRPRGPHRGISGVFRAPLRLCRRACPQRAIGLLGRAV